MKLFLVLAGMCGVILGVTTAPPSAEAAPNLARAYSLDG